MPYSCGSCLCHICNNLHSLQNVYILIFKTHKNNREIKHQPIVFNQKGSVLSLIDLAAHAVVQITVKQKLLKKNILHLK